MQGGFPIAAEHADAQAAVSEQEAKVAGHAGAVVSGGEAKVAGHADAGAVVSRGTKSSPYRICCLTAALSL